MLLLALAVGLGPVRPASAAAGAPADVCVAVPSAGVYARPSQAGALLKWKPQGSLIRAVGTVRGAQRQGSNLWFTVALSGTSRLGYMHAWDLQACPGADPTTVSSSAGAGLHRCPSTSCERIRWKPAGSPIQVRRPVQGASGLWYEVVLGDSPLPGYMPAGAFGQGGPASASPPAGAAVTGLNHLGQPRLALANYFPWYNFHDGSLAGATWDWPTHAYNSDDPAAIARHLAWARQAGLDGFAVHWFQPGDRTDRNLAQILDQSRGSEFRSAVTFQTNILPGVSRERVAASLGYLRDAYGGHPQYLRAGGRMVVLFTDMPRLPRRPGQAALQAWRAIRQEVDPHRQQVWMAEGLDPAYLEVFDGLYVYKIDHALYPHSYVKAPRWAGWVRAWERASGQPRYWVGTVQPGWDDTRSLGREDLRVPSPAFARERAAGAYYRATFEAVLPTDPDWILVHSFNEWVEGSMIEPGRSYGDLYLKLTAELVRQFKAR